MNECVRIALHTEDTCAFYYVQFHHSIEFVFVIVIDVLLPVSVCWLFFRAPIHDPHLVHCDRSKLAYKKCN